MPASATANSRLASAFVGKRSSSRGVRSRRRVSGPASRGVDVSPADDREAELRVQRARPVVGERLEVHELARPQSLVERVLDDRTAEAAAPKLLEDLDVLDLRHAVPLSELAPAGDRPVDLGAEEARRNRRRDESLRIVQLRRDLGVAPWLAQGRFGSKRDQVVELDRPDRADVDAPVGLGGVSEHEMRHALEPELREVVRKPGRTVLDDHAGMVARLERSLGIHGKVAGAGSGRLDGQVVAVVYVGDRVGDDRSAGRQRERPIGRGAL
jgi:hypothetical protein